MLDQWIATEWQNRPTEGLRRPSMPACALTPNEMWGAMLGATGHVPLPLTGDDYIELLPVVWKPITERGIRLNHRTYDHPALTDYRGQPSGVTAQQGRWEVHHNPHDARRIWVRLSDGAFTPIPWIHADHVHQPFGDQLWQHLKDTVTRRGDRDRHEADLAQALDDVLRRARNGTAHPREHALITRHAVGPQRPRPAGQRRRAGLRRTGRPGTPRQMAGRTPRAGRSRHRPDHPGHPPELTRNGPPCRSPGIRAGRAACSTWWPHLRWSLGRRHPPAVDDSSGADTTVSVLSHTTAHRHCADQRVLNDHSQTTVLRHSCGA
ncbi:Mu transposase C-terminal domain-containing protein [Kitasatospora sp. NPDC005856]|uniref:Mu transposase C-terminal domain-containing protein n=1 Tax=Kitasatospora sp. NPDC005856 TaxID=3154566 RepID=UPI0033F9B21B